MALKNQKGIVRYQGRDDIICNYGIRDDGKQFYYLDVNGGVPFKNGNRVATTALVEAVDPMVKASNVGLIDADGNEVIPFTNRSIRSVNDDIIIVEPATPTTQSVVEAIQLKSNPLSATKLVSTPATIKDKLNTKVGSEGRYLFNDQFSEATVCDINGNNLVNGDSYSFIVSNGKELYFSKNTVDSDITSYSLSSPEVQSDVASTNAGEVIDVRDVNVSQDVVENALNSDTQVESLASESDVNSVDEKLDGDITAEEVLDEGQKVESLAPANPDDSNVESASVEVAPAVEEAVQENVVEEVSQAAPLNNVIESVSADVEVPTDSVAADNAMDIVVPASLGEETQNVVVESTVVPSEIQNKESTGAQNVGNDNEIKLDDIFATESESTVDVQEEEKENVEESSEKVDEEPVEAVKEDESQVDAVEENVVDNDVKLDDIFATESESTTDVREEEKENVEESSEKVDEEPVEAVKEEEKQVDVAEDNVKLDDIFADTSENTVEKYNNEEKSDVGLNPDIFGSDSSKNASSLDDMINGDSSLEERPSSMGYTNSLEDFYSNNTDTIVQDTFNVSNRDVYDDVYGDIAHDDISPYNYSNYNMSSISRSDNIMADVARSMTDMMKRIRDLEKDLSLERDKAVKLQASRRNLADKNHLLSQEVDAYKNKVGSLDAKLAQASSKVSVLETRVHEQSRAIAAQEQELRVLRPLLTGKDEVVGILADAQALLGEGSKIR